MVGGEEFREEEERPGARADAAAFFATNPAVTLSGEPVVWQIIISCTARPVTDKTGLVAKKDAKKGQVEEVSESRSGWGGRRPEMRKEEE